MPNKEQWEEIKKLIPKLNSNQNLLVWNKAGTDDTQLAPRIGRTVNGDVRLEINQTVYRVTNEVYDVIARDLS